MKPSMTINDKISPELINKRIEFTAICRGWQVEDIQFGMQWFIAMSDIKTVDGSYLVYPGKTVWKKATKALVDADLNDGDTFTFTATIKNTGKYLDIYSLFWITNVVKSLEVT